MEISEKNIRAAYYAADSDTKTLLSNLFPELNLGKPKSEVLPITERVKSFEDACDILGLDPSALENTWFNCGLVSADEVAYQKLRLIVNALNEGWEPQFTEEERRWYPWHYLYTQDEIDDMTDADLDGMAWINTGAYKTEFAGFAYATSLRVPSYTTAYFGSRLCLKSESVASYCGKQFIELWADFKLIRR